ncbi:stalk domain-containing protein [Paenibacillus yanchengensis]|uniref:Stalk domain-containing protein n=1 Tax=Paenibacillus yanchengensis TaxID=2035833 RepID=A0ABW4YKS5_9BACL
MKKFIVGIIIGSLLTVGIPAVAKEVTEVVKAKIRGDYEVMVEDKKISLEKPVLIYDDTSYLPVREVASILGKDVTFQNGTINLKTKTIDKNTEIKIKVVKKDGEADELTVKMEEVDGVLQPYIEKTPEELLYNLEFELSNLDFSIKADKYDLERVSYSSEEARKKVEDRISDNQKKLKDTEKQIAELLEKHPELKNN